jgi:hypothetical protein
MIHSLEPTLILALLPFHTLGLAVATERRMVMVTRIPSHELSFLTERGWVVTQTDEPVDRVRVPGEPPVEFAPCHPYHASSPSGRYVLVERHGVYGRQ